MSMPEGSSELLCSDSSHDPFPICLEAVLSKLTPVSLEKQGEARQHRVRRIGHKVKNLDAVVKKIALNNVGGVNRTLSQWKNYFCSSRIVLFFFKCIMKMPKT
jgi:hypothetical protein